MENTLTHLAVIMDGNRRWAKKQGLSFGVGYAKGGTQAIQTTMEFCLRRGISYLSLYTFSLENFKRPQVEQDFLFSTIVSEGAKQLPFLQEHNIRVQFIGDRSRFPEKVRPICQMLEEETKDFSKLCVNFLFCYGGRQELVSVAQRIAADVQKGLLTHDAVTEELFERYLWTVGTPDPELIIRTSGVHRLSNFLSYQSAYSEFCFLDCLWPEITTEILTEAVDNFLGMKRNFGV